VAGRLDGLLLANEGKAARDRLPLIRLSEESRGLGCDGSYDAVWGHTKVWLAAQLLHLVGHRGPRPSTGKPLFRGFAEVLLPA
jgi:hypothetical protein